MFDVRLLFSPRVFPDDLQEREIERIAAGDKALGWYPMKSEIVREYSDFDELAAKATEAGLSVSIRPRSRVIPGGEDLDVFIGRECEMWRAEAFRVCNDCSGRYRWSDAAEMMESTFLGYSEEERSEWIRLCQHNRLGWAGQTTYLLSRIVARGTLG